MLKKLIAQLSDVDEKYRGLYAKQEDGTYKLDADIIPSNVEDVTGLKNNNVDLKNEKIKLQEQLDVLNAQTTQQEEDDLKASNNYEKLLKIQTDKSDAVILEATGKTDKAVNALKKSLIDSAVSGLAINLAGEAAELLIPHLKNRFQVNEVDGEFVLQITDVNGTVSALTSDQLGEEFKTDKKFAPILKGRQSSGSGSDNGSGGEGGGTEGYDKYFNPAGDDYDTNKQYELEKKDKKAHDALVKKYKLDDPYAP